MIVLYLKCGALVWEWTTEEDRDDVHQGVCYVMLECRVRVLPVVRSVRDDGHVEQEAPFEKPPHVMWRVDLLHLDLCVDVAVSEEIYVGVFYLKLRGQYC